MTHLAITVLTGLVVEEHAQFTLIELCRAAGASREQVFGLVDEGLLEPAGAQPDEWRFDGRALPCARQALRLAHELDINFAGAAVVLQLLAEIDTLRTRLRTR